MGHIRLCSPGTASSHKSRITYYLAQIYSCIGSVDFPLSFIVPQQCFSKQRSWSPWELWQGSKRGLEVAGEVVLITSSPSCGSTVFALAAALVWAVVPSFLQAVGSSHAHQPLRASSTSVEPHHHEPDRGADLAEETVHQTNTLSSWSDQFPSPILS